MIIVVSPAKALDFATSAPIQEYTQPLFLDQSAQLIDLLQGKTPAEIARLMSLSDKLAALNVARYASWSRPFSLENAKQAVYAFDGDVYEGLDAATLKPQGVEWLQKHFRILSGLYGVLRPLDLMQPYRLEMGTKLLNQRGKDLYAFWGGRITDALNILLADDGRSGEDKVLVNLASAEYFKSIQTGRLEARIVTPVFEEWKNGRYRIVSFHAKRARGLMSRYAAENRIADVEQLKKFRMEEYAFDSSASDADKWVFRRGRH